MLKKCFKIIENKSCVDTSIYMPSEDSKDQNGRESMTYSLEECVLEASLESSLPFNKEAELALPPKVGCAGNYQDHVMTHNQPGACASCKSSRPEVTPGTTKEDCKCCGSHEDNVKTNFSYLKKDLDPAEIIDLIIQKGSILTSYCHEDIEGEPSRRRKVDILVKELLRVGQDGCQCLIESLLRINAFQFMPVKMHERHLDRSKKNVVAYAINSSHLSNEHEYIVDNLDPEETADLLLEEYVISHLDHEEIVKPQAHKSRRSMSKEMVKKLLCKNQDELNLFLFVLEHTEHGCNGNIARKLQSISGREIQKKTKLISFYKTNKFKSVQIRTTDKAKEAVENMNSTKVSLKLSFRDGKSRPLSDVEEKVLNTFKQKKDVMDDLADAFAKLSIKDIAKGSIVIQIELESVNHVNKFRYAVTNGEVESFVNRLLESADIHKIIPKNGLNVEIDVLIKEEDRSSERRKVWSSAQRCIVDNMAYIVEELNPSPILKMYQEKQFLSESEMKSILQLGTSRRLQAQALMKIILTKDDRDVDNFFSILQSGKQVHIFDRIKSPRCADCIKERIKQCRQNLVEELDAVTIRDTLDRCENVPYDLYSDPGQQRIDRNQRFLKLLKDSDESLLIFDDVLFAAGISSLLKCETAAQRDHVCSKCYVKGNYETKDKYQKIIKENVDILAPSINTPDIVVALVERGVLTYEEKALIMNEKTVYKSSKSLLDIIIKKGSDSCSVFADVLQEQVCDQSVYELFQVEYAGGGWIDQRVNSKPKEQLPSDYPFECSQIKVVAAIDFGTTYSGFAYSYTGETSISKIKTKQWKAVSGSSLVSLKTPSCLLLKKDKSVESFGFEANAKYIELAEDEEHWDWHYFKQFKMLLHNKSDLRWDTKIMDDQGHELNALDIFSHSIKHLKDELLKHINKADDKNILEQEISWVLTVPAIWDEPAKQFMREAAHQAGIPHCHLVLALEPEAAAIYVKQISISKETDESKGPRLTTFKPGTKFVVLDVGGGTVDATIMKISKDNKLQNLHEASGGDWGGQKVNKAINSLFEEVFGSDVMEKFKSEYKSDHLELELAIETSKRNVDSVSANKLDMVFPDTLMVAFKSFNSDTDVPVIASKYAGKVEVRKQRLRIDKDLFKELFSPCIENIVKHAKSILGEEGSKGVEYMICVGGFSDCQYLQQELKKSFPDLRVIIPPDAGLAVLKGAVLYGQTPGIIKTRIIPFTYGTSVYRYFLKDHDDESKLYYHHDQPYCKDVFNKLVETGCSYSVGYKVEQEVHPMSADMTKMSVKIYRSTDKNPKYVTDESCSYLGKMVVNMPDIQGGLNRTVLVSLTFGETELMVEGLDKSSNEKVRVSLDLLSTDN